MSERSYLPALRFAALTRFFDPLVRIGLPEGRLKGRLIEAAAPRDGQRILDLGCGTGTLAIMVKRAAPGADVVGLDADPAILEIARAKAEDAGVEIRLIQGFSTVVPYEDRSFDRVISTLFFHHLDGEGKRRTIFQIARILKPGGELHVGDVGRPQDQLMRAAVMPLRVFDGFEQTRDNVAGRLPDLFAEAGLADAEETERMRSAVGTLSLYRARRPRRLIVAARASRAVRR